MDKAPVPVLLRRECLQTAGQQGKEVVVWVALLVAGGGVDGPLSKP